MLPHILICCFVATVALALPLEKENAKLPPVDHSVSVGTAEASEPKNVPIPVENRREVRSKDEIMDTASSIVFRPLFAYRQQVAQRRRVYQNKKNNRNTNNNNNRRQSNRPQKQGYPYGYPSYGYPYYMDRDFPHVP